ncbi:MAG: class I SAM-dependent methyltransferase [Rhodocyclaceae bacterium]|jgi:asparagine synthase (glutamine-hydrolysing)|nr:class I SAM-dependent methyltransferase [Rhodocyclaceae bacterium]MCA3137637.1 class I SAM-dependent methyltransferase [Rhodocyclaceae bacterium]
MKKLFARLFGHPTVAAPAIPTMAEAEAIIARIRGDNLSYCGKPKLENIAEAVLAVREAGVPGGFLEAGVALGGSAILLGKIKPKDAPLALYDVFSMIPAPGENDGEDAHKRYEEISSGQSAGLGGKTYYGYVDKLLDVVKQNLRDAGLDLVEDHIECIPGLFDETLHPAGPIALAHVDCDWYESVKVCVDRIAPHLSKGGIIVFDDYSSYSGCRSAVDEWMERDARFQKLFHRRSLAVKRVG